MGNYTFISEKLASATSPIESLPLDMMAPLLSSCASLDDLNAIIHSSPILYRGFLTAKRSILLAFLERDLGTGLRDAVALALLEQRKIHQCRGRLTSPAEHIRQVYSNLPLADLATRAISTDLVVRMFQINRSVQFLVDWYADSKLPVFATAARAASYPITPEERYRIATALVRFQIMINLTPRGCGTKYNLDSEKQILCTVFEPWQMEQAYEMHRFFYPVQALFERNSPVYELFTPMSRRECLSSIEFLRRHITVSCEMRPGEALRVRLAMQTALEKNVYPGYCFHWLGGSHYFTNRDTVIDTYPLRDWEVEIFRARDSLYALEERSPLLVHGNTASDPPFAWVDALGGLDCRRWGHDLVRAAPTRRPSEDGFNVSRKLDGWRLFGFMFWDAQRVGHLSTNTSDPTGFGTGWLINIWEDVVRIRRVENPWPVPVDDWSTEESEED
ncbi:hypothetical protein GGR57DRAFT_369184 [Xylariaceae sp. FL1272]|nr:hypothetical protein GGR57DRAFT_369184 [Xylariaceae sp. FL1272]